MRAVAAGNTVRAFDLAVEAGADGIELDFRRTVDGQWVAYHDKTFTEGGRRQRVARAQRTTLGASVASLDEVVAWVAGHPTVVVDVEVKDYGHEIELLDPFRPFMDRVVFTSFIPDIVWSLRQAEPEARTGFLAAYHGPFNLEIARLAGCQYVVWRDAELGRGLVERSLEKGLRPWVWDVDSRRRMAELASWGVQAVVTDRIPRPQTTSKA